MKNESLLKSTAIVSILVIVCKLFGFARESIIAAYFGANAETDAFFFAQGMPATIFPSICNSISTAFTAIYVKKNVSVEKDSGYRYATEMLIMTSGLGIALSLVGVLSSSFLVKVFAPGFSGEQLLLATRLTKIVMGAFFLIMLQYMLSAILNSNKCFYSAQIGNIINNIVIIALTLSFGKSHDIEVLTYIVLVGLLINVAFLWIPSRHFYGKLNKIVLNRVDINELIRLATPIVIGNSVIQINTIVDKALGSTLESGSLSALTYAGTINALVTGVFITSLSTVLYPTLTETAALEDMQSFGLHVTRSLGILSIFLTYISFAFFLDAHSIITIVFGHGLFMSDAINLTSSVLSVYAVSYVFAGIREVITRACYAIHDTKTPMLNSVIGVMFNVLFSIIFVKRIGVSGIALGTTLASIIISILLVIQIRKKLPDLKMNLFLTSFRKQIVSGIIMSVVLSLWGPFFASMNLYLRTVIRIALGFCIYIVVLLLLRCQECNMIVNDLKKRFK